MKKTALVIDDNLDILEVVKVILEEEGYNVITCTRGEYVEDIAWKAHNLIDVIILDVFLSGMDGRDITRHLKEKHTTKEIPIIMFSAYPNAKEAALQAGASDFLPKPFHMNELIATVQKYTN